MTLEVSDDDMKKEIANISKKFDNPEVLQRLKDMYEKDTKHYGELKNRLTYTKIIESFLVEKKTAAKK
jgi:FKBP-type peptidyl-prolyl cis-trans isomerase (trigger factor)